MPTSTLRANNGSNLSAHQHQIDKAGDTGYLQYPMTAIVERDRKKDTYIHVNLTAELTQDCEALKKIFLVKKMNKNK